MITMTGRCKLRSYDIQYLKPLCVDARRIVEILHISFDKFCGYVELTSVFDAVKSICARQVLRLHQ